MGRQLKIPRDASRRRELVARRTKRLVTTLAGDAEALIVVRDVVRLMAIRSRGGTI